jgi:hypothetical protein
MNSNSITDLVQIIFSEIRNLLEINTNTYFRIEREDTEEPERQTANKLAKEAETIHTRIAYDLIPNSYLKNLNKRILNCGIDASTLPIITNRFID